LDENGQPEMIEATQAILVRFPELQQEDPKTLAEALAIATSSEWVSNEGAGDIIASTLGLDPAIERKRIAREQEQNRDAAGMGLVIRPQDVAGEQENDETSRSANA
jgi:hypothetical protein